MKKIIEFKKAFDRRNIDPAKNYGIHGVEIRFILKGDKGAVQFLLFTNWQLPHVTQEMINKPINDRLDIKCMWLPLPADIGYHSPKPLYEGQESITKSCEYLDNKPCYYDVSGLNAERYYNILLEQGGDGLWDAMEEYYNEIFETDKMESEK